MSKLVTLCLTVVLIFGICTYIFNPTGGTGIKQQVRDGHTTITRNMRGFDYMTN